MKDYKIVNYMQVPLDIKPSHARKTCFVVYSSREPHIGIVLDSIEMVIGNSDQFEVRRLAVHGISGNSQYSQLIEFLNKCSLAIIVLDGFRPNVLFEYGVLIGLKKPCIVLLDINASIDINSLANSGDDANNVRIDMDKDFSDVKDQMYVQYNHNDPKNLREILCAELKKLEPFIDEAFSRLIFPNKDQFDQEIRESLEIFSELANSKTKLTAADVVTFRVCVKDIERTAKRFGIELTEYYYLEKASMLNDLELYDEVVTMVDGLAKEFKNLVGPKAYALNQLNRSEDALTCLNEELRNDVDNESLWHQKALLLEQLNRKDEAAICYMKGTGCSETCANIHYSYSFLLNERDDFDEALKQIEIALLKKPNYPIYMVQKAIILKSNDKYGEARALLLDALALDTSNPYAWFQLGTLTDNDTEAFKYLDKCLALKPDHAGAHCKKAQRLSLQSDLESALAEFNVTLQLCSKYKKSELCQKFESDIGRIKYELYRTGKIQHKNLYEEAIKHLSNAITCTSDPSELAELYNNLGYMYLAEKRTTESLQCLVKAVELCDENKYQISLTYYNIAMCHVVDNNIDLAVEKLNYALDVTNLYNLQTENCYCMFTPQATSQNTFNIAEIHGNPLLVDTIQSALQCLEHGQNDM